MVREVAVVRVLIKHTLTVTWELVVRPGEDLRILRYDEYFGFGVDSGMGCFVDEAGREPLGARYEGPLEGGDFLLLEDEEREADLIAFRSGRGDGHYPVWVDRDADGCVTSFVADMRVLPDEEVELYARTGEALQTDATPRRSSRLTEVNAS